MKQFSYPSDDVHFPVHTVKAGQIWRDEAGQVRVLAVAEGYAMLKRRRRNPFVASVSQLLRGDYGWTLLSDIDDMGDMDDDSDY